MTRDRRKGVFAVIIDGVADLCTDVNNPVEANQLVAELQALALEFNCPVIVVLHENAGHDNGKARGHLGSQLERKAESNLRLKKSGEITTVFSERGMRKAPIAEADGPRFHWGHAEQMHVSVESASAEKAGELRELASAIFGAAEQMSWTAVVEAIQKKCDCSTRTAERKVTKMQEDKIVGKGKGGKKGPLYLIPRDNPATASAAGISTSSFDRNHLNRAA